MAQMLFEVVWHYTGETPGRFTKKLMQKQYMEMREVAVDTINPQIDGWNREYEEKYGAVQGEDDLRYNGFISMKESEILRLVNHHKKFHKYQTYLDVDRSNGDIVGKRKGHDTTLYMCIKPIAM